MFKRFMFVEGFASIFGSEGKYFINNNGEIQDSSGSAVETHINEEGDVVVDCVAYKGQATYRVIDLMVIAFKYIYIPIDDYDKIVAFVIDGNRSNLKAVNIGYRFLGGKLEYGKRPGFYYVPGFTWIAINKEGVGFCAVRDRILNISFTPPYAKKNIKGGYGVFNNAFVNFRTSRHRALMLTFTEYKDNVDDLTVNHKDGVPGNDDLSNLEWATRSENNIHAYMNDLKNQHMRILARNVITGEVKEFYSISECARRLGYPTDETIRFRLYKCEFGRVFQDGFQFKLKGDERDWIIPNNPKEAIKEAQNKIPIKTRDCLTKVEKVYDSAGKICKELKVTHTSILNWARDKTGAPRLGYQFKYAYDDTPWEKFTEKQLRDSYRVSGWRVKAKNHLTQETREFKSIKEARKFIGRDLSKLNGGGKLLTSSGWEFSNIDEEWSSFENLEETLYLMQPEIMARNEETGEVFIADSARKMSEILYLDAKEIRRAAATRGNEVYKGYRFRRGVSKEPWPNSTLPSQKCLQQT